MQQVYPSGTRIAGRYEVAGVPLLGGMGIVYLCFDHEGQRPVALKTFKPEYLSDRAARERFLQEGEIWVRLGKHPHIVRCYAVFQDSPRPEVYLVLELIAKEEGRRDASLRSWLTPGRPLPVEQALLIALQIARGMKHATETIPGFVHRDLKPENVLVGADRLSNAPINRVRVTDFGLVKSLRAEQVPALATDDLATKPSRLTQVGAVVGTPLYMAPEQWAGADVSAQADIYALGCILSEMLIGRPLAQGRTLDELRRAHQGGQVLAAVQVALGDQSDLLAGWLAVEPGRRYDSWSALEAALAAAYRQAAGQPPPEVEPAGALSRAERVAVGWSYVVMGVSYLDLGQSDQAPEFFAKAQQVALAVEERQLTGAALNNLGNAYTALGDARQAIGYHDQSLAIYREICATSTKGSLEWVRGHRGEALALGSLGVAYLHLGNARHASRYYEQYLALAREIGDRQSECGALCNLGNACLQLGDARRASECHEQALIIAREIGDRRGEGAVLSGLGNAYYHSGAPHKAIRFYEQTLAISREIGDDRSAGNTLNNLGITFNELGDTLQAIGCYKQSLMIAQKLGDLRGEGAALSNLGSAYDTLGDARQAIEYHKQALAIHQQINDRREEGHDLGKLGAAYGGLRDASRAIEYHEQALTIAQEVNDLDDIALLSLSLAYLLPMQGRDAEAVTYAQTAADGFSRLGNAEYAKLAQRLAGQIRGRGVRS